MSTSGQNNESIAWEEYLRGYNDRKEEMQAEEDGLDDLRSRLLLSGYNSEDSSKIVAVVRSWLDT